MRSPSLPHDRLTSPPGSPNPNRAFGKATRSRATRRARSDENGILGSIVSVRPRSEMTATSHDLVQDFDQAMMQIYVQAKE